MQITRALSERYLWVDSLCIIKDSEESKLQQICQMGTIFAKSYLTLVDVDGQNADHGLPGVNQSCCPRKSSQKIIQILPDLSLSTVNHIRPYRSSWYSRGWTYQEMCLSRRMLLFTKHGLAWDCQLMYSTEYQQGFEELSNGDTPFHSPLSLYLYSWLSFSEYGSMIRNYNVRHLTFAEDALAAFDGIINHSRRSYGDIHFGIPEMFFDLALSWQPEGKIVRRGSVYGDTPS